MPAHNTYFPLRIGDQIIWVRNWRTKLGGYQTAGGYTAGEISAQVADSDFILQLIESWHPGAKQYVQGATAYVKFILYGPIATAISPVPLYNGNPTSGPPPAPMWPAVVPPGALLRIFAFAENMKTRAFCTPAVQEDLMIIGTAANVVVDPVPPASAESRSGEVVVHFKKKMPAETRSHMGAWIEGQVGNETEWTFLAIDTTDPYNDTRPLKVPGQPEKRRYRLCFWDGEPSRVWTAVIEVTHGG